MIRFFQLLVITALIFLSAILLPHVARALVPAKAITQDVLTNWTIESELPQHFVHSIAQASDEYPSFGTEEGVTRFDGVQFKTFTVPAENSDRLWKRIGDTFTFFLATPLTHTWYAYLAYSLLALLLAWRVIALRTRTFIRRQHELMRVFAERNAQLESEKAALEVARRELQVQATHDSLTGVFNRAAIVEHLERAVVRAVCENRPVGIVIADLDHFKRFNDQYGHLCGDDIIRETTDRFRSALGDHDVVGRYGGEEFLLLFPGLDLVTAPGRVDDLWDAIRCRPFIIAGTEIPVTCSFGVATFLPSIDQPAIRDLLHRADTALYVAKDSGRDCVSFEARICQ